MTDKHVKRRSVGKCKSKPQWEIIIYPLEWLLSKTNKQKITGVAKDAEKLEPSYIAGGSTVQPLQKAARWCPKKLKTELLYDPAIPFSVQFSHSVVSNSLRPHESQHARPPCPSPTPGVHSDSCPSSQ